METRRATAKSPGSRSRISRESYAGSLEVVKVFGETFLAKRFAAGKDEGLEEGVVKGREEGREEGVVKGREEGRGERDAEIRAELRRLLVEDPETVVERLKDWLGNGDAPLNGKESGQSRPD